VKTKAPASLEVIGGRVLRSSRRLFALPALDETRAIYRDLTTIPIVRLSQALEPLCGTAQHAPLRRLDEDVRPTVAAAGTPAMAASPRPGLPQAAKSAEAAKVFAAMNALNLNPRAARSNRLSDGRPQQRSTAKSVENDNASETLTRAPVRAGNPQPHEDRSRIQEPAPAGMSRPDAWPLPDPPATMPAAGSTTTDAVGSARPAPAGLRMAQGAPRIAALLQAHVAGNNQSDDKTSQSVQPVPNPYPIGFEAKAEDPRLAHNAGNTAVAVDMDLLMERLSQQLEFELMRIYGTSEG
jgi:hypothetical protein